MVHRQIIPVHPEMQSHSGIYITLGKGATYSTYSKDKIIIKSSKEPKLVVIDNSMAQVL